MTYIELTETERSLNLQYTEVKLILDFIGPPKDMLQIKIKWYALFRLLS